MICDAMMSYIIPKPTDVVPKRTLNLYNAFHKIGCLLVSATGKFRFSISLKSNPIYYEIFHANATNVSGKVKKIFIKI